MATAQPGVAAADLSPLIAGAHARGMFDALDMMGQGAILLDAQGCALAVTRAAVRRLGADLALRARRPVGRVGDDDSRLQRAIREALAGVGSSVEIGRPGEELNVRLKPIPADPNQLLAAILLIESPDDRDKRRELTAFRPPRGASATH